MVGTYSIFQGCATPGKGASHRGPRAPAGPGRNDIVQLTDLHIGATKSRSFAKDIVSRTNALARTSS